MGEKMRTKVCTEGKKPFLGVLDDLTFDVYL
jgi:hypothetical protein